MNKLVIKTILNAEMSEHLGHEKNQKKHGSNSCSAIAKSRY
ncbi:MULTISPECIES: hypothetical protein [unclassified Gilliamella]|nr:MULTISPECIES: hypothetical protein [unclassified Gilliamella]